MFLVFVCIFHGHCRLQILCGRLASVGLAQARPNNLQITWISWNTLLSIAKNVYSSNCCKTTPHTLEYLLNCIIVFLLYYSFKILPAKPPGYSSFSFRARKSVRFTPTFQLMRYAFPMSLTGQFGCFLVVKQQ